MCIPWIKEQDETCRRTLIVANQVTAKELKFCKLNFDDNILFRHLVSPEFSSVHLKEYKCFNNQRDDLLILVVVNSTRLYEINCQV
jgi:hypothetical protein